MKTTFWQLLEQYKITIPIIQRDYAQGRKDKKTARIRRALLDTIKRAFDEGSAVDFDFVYGTSNEGSLYPLDGQQRLTTLFLLHWYLAAKGGLLDADIKLQLKKFSYQTRISSQRFCEKLVEFSPTTDGELSVIIEDQPWFASAWNNDPTIEAMRTMLDEIQKTFNGNDPDYYKERFLLLTNQQIIHFQFLDMDSFNLSDDLYIKMNARGKPLTEFENFKARFEKYLTDTARDEEKRRFVDRADGQWTDLFWQEMPSAMDVGFMRYFDFITEVGFYTLNSDSEKIGENDNDLKFRVFESGDVLNLLFDSLDAWCAVASKEGYFNHYFTDAKHEAGKVKLYEENLNLFARCLHCVDFTAKDQLMLYAVILQLIGKQDKIAELRLIRNLLLNSPFEIRAGNKHNLFCSVQNIMNGTVDYIALKKVFSGPQVDDEKNKAEFVQNHKELAEELYHFEDHYILKGCMSAIELDPRTLKQHRTVFSELFSREVDRNTISRAVLCFGDYSQEWSCDRWRFANSDDSWHSILTSADVDKVKSALSQLLDAMPGSTLQDIISAKISELVAGGDLTWRYYFIKYPEMNCLGRAIYVWHSNFDVCMLNTTRLSGYWKDPYLWSICCLFPDAVEKGQIKDVGNIGREKSPLNVCGIELSVCDQGWRVLPNANDNTAQMRYENICNSDSISDGVLQVPSNVDRIEVGAKLVTAIIAQQ